MEELTTAELNDIHPELLTIVRELKNAFRVQSVKESVLNPKQNGINWIDKNKKSGIPETGFCYSASRLIYHSTGGKEKWFLNSVEIDKDTGEKHCFLELKKPDGTRSYKILDVTKEQYTQRKPPVEIPYNNSRRGDIRCSKYDKQLKSYLKL